MVEHRQGPRMLDAEARLTGSDDDECIDLVLPSFRLSLKMHTAGAQDVIAALSSSLVAWCAHTFHVADAFAGEGEIEAATVLNDSAARIADTHVELLRHTLQRLEAIRGDASILSDADRQKIRADFDEALAAAAP